MTDTKPGTVAAAFANGGLAAQVIDELLHEGFTQEQIGLVTRDGRVIEPKTAATALEDRAAEGAAAGAVTGAAVGTLAGVVLLNLVPGLGQVITGGALAGIIGSAALGAATGSLVGPFLAMGLSEDEAEYFAERFEAGSTVLLVKAGDKAEDARAVFRRFGGVMLEPAAVAPRA